jgi:hypothetical protein
VFERPDRKSFEWARPELPEVIKAAKLCDLDKLERRMNAGTNPQEA